MYLHQFLTENFVFALMAYFPIGQTMMVNQQQGKAEENEAATIQSNFNDKSHLSEKKIAKWKPNHDTPWGCTSLDCSLNPALDPCEDFYEYVCSGFMRDAEKPHGDFYSYKSQFNILWERSYEDVLGLLNNHAIRKSTRGQLHMQQMFTFYDACLNVEARKAERNRGLLAWLREIGYEAGKHIRRFDTDWWLLAFPSVPFVNLYTNWDVRPETDGKSMFVFDAVKPLITADKGAQLESDLVFRKSFAEKKAKQLSLLVEDDRASGQKPIFAVMETEIDRRVDNLIQMEIEMAKIIAIHPYESESERFPKYLDQPELYVPVEKLRDHYGFDVDWLRVYNHFGSSAPPHLNKHEDVLVTNHKLLLAYNRLIQSVDPQVLSDYLEWALFWPWLFDPDDDSDFSKLLKKPEPERARRCVGRAVRVFFPHWLDRLYVKHVFDGKRLVGPSEELLRSVKEGFERLLKENDWMDAGLKQRVQHKLHALHQTIGYHHNVLNNDELLAQLYGKYEFHSDMTFEQMHARMNRHFHLWPTYDYQSSIIVDGLYQYVINSLAIHGAIIRPPWFDPESAPAMKFGAMGTFMGHEITHGFDSIGWHFDERGNLKRKHDPSMEKMKGPMQCFVDQYGRYEKEEPLWKSSSRPSPQFTLSENIADNGAIRASFNAWLEYKKERNDDMTSSSGVGHLVAKMLFDDEQLFFIASAFFHCTAMPDEKTMANYAKYDNHATPRARVNLPLRNFDAFAHTFHCPVGSKMNPAADEKCRLW